MKQYAVIYEKGETNWGAIVPDLPGCVSIGAGSYTHLTLPTIYTV